MQINRAVFHNFGRHRELALDFTRGLIGIIGPNGSGKSTITDGIYAALTGDFTRFNGVKTDSICDMASESEPSFVELEAEHDEIKFVLRRSLRPIKNSLSIEGEETITNSNMIQAGMEERLGINNKLIDAYVFVSQWRMFEFISQTRIKRAEAYQHLCNTIAAAVIHDLAGKELEAVGSIGDIVDNSDDLRVRIGKDKKALEKTQKSRDSVEAKRLSDERRDKANEFIRRFDRCVTLQPLIEQAEGEVNKHQKTIDGVLKPMSEKKGLLRKMEAFVEELRPQANAARVAISQFEAHRQAEASKEKYGVELKRLEADAEAHPQPVKLEDDDDSLQALREELATANAVRDRAEEIVKKFKEDGVTECPTCGMPVSDMGEHLSEVEDAAANGDVLCNDLTQTLEGSEQQQKEWQAWKYWKNTHTEQVRAVDTVLAELKSIEVPEGTLEDFRAVIKDLQEQEGNLGIVRTSCADLCNRYDTAQALRKSSNDRLEKLVHEFNKKTVKETTVEKARKALETDTERSEKIAVFDERIRGLEKSISDDEASIEKIEFKLSKHTQKLRYRQLMEGIREVTHAKALPQVVAQRNLEDMEADINAALGKFGDPFWVEADKDLTFNVHFPGEPARSAARLSGGQKVVLAVAFRTVVSSLFGAELGMLVLDEPAAGLDERNIGFLSDALSQFAAEVRGRRQIIVITHAQALKPAFDQVIELE